MNKRLRFIFEILGYILLCFLVGCVIVDIVMNCIEKTGFIYCNYAIDNGDYTDDLQGRMSCAVDFLELVLDEEDRK